MPRLVLAVSGTLFAFAACDRAPEAVIVPEFEFSFSFESGLDGWTPSSADLGTGTGSIQGSSENASQGTRSAAVHLDNAGGAGKVWITRELEVTPDQSYAVDVSFDLGTSDHGTGEPWRLIVGVRDTIPSSTAALDYHGDTASGAETAVGHVWAEKGTTVGAKADEEGRLYLTLGVWGTTPGQRSYWIDNVRVVLTRS